MQREAPDGHEVKVILYYGRSLLAPKFPENLADIYPRIPMDLLYLHMAEPAGPAGGKIHDIYSELVKVPSGRLF